MRCLTSVTLFSLPPRFPGAYGLNPRGGRRCCDSCQSLLTYPRHDRGGATGVTGRAGEGQEEMGEVEKVVVQRIKMKLEVCQLDSSCGQFFCLALPHILLS